MDEKKGRRLIVVSNRLPVRVEDVEGEFQYQQSVGGLTTTIDVLRERLDMIWFGTPGLSVEDERSETEISAKLWEDFKCVPLFIDAKEFNLFYNGFSNGSIWPMFHYFPQYAHYDQSEWQAYHDVNQKFCDEIVRITRPGDLIWVHDYHLMLLPAMLREVLPDAPIGFFLHIPFPSYEIFRALPWREEILEGLLGADLVGFHTFGYARHFISSLMRLLGLEHEFGQVTVGERAVKIDTFPLGVNVDRFSSAIEDEAVQTELKDLRQKTEGQKVVLSVDRLDFTKGILHRLNAYEKFLMEHEEWHERVTLVSLLVPSRTHVPEYQLIKSQVDEMIGRLNGKFSQPGWTPIWYLYRSVPFSELIALYQLADVALVTPLRDGMNLVAKEYVASRPDGTGVLVLSETAGAAAELGEAILVNPHDEEMMVDALIRALSMPVEEQKQRNFVMRARLRRYDTDRWADDFINQLEWAQSLHAGQQPRRLLGDLQEQVLHDFQKAEQSLMLLDYDGTLVSFARTPEGAKPDKELLELLSKLTGSSKNTVVVISGRDSDTLEAWLGGTGVDMVAEHGAKTRLAGDDDWQITEEDYSNEWKARLRPVFEVYVDRTPGALLEEKGAALVWHYRRADPGLGELRAAELIQTLEGFVANTSLHILQGHKVIEVKPSTVSKGKAAQPWLTRKPRNDFVLAIGDDVTDEALFEAVPEDCWSVKVGIPGHSKARYYLSDPFEVRRLLRTLSAAMDD
jgi:trehalose 6-phosphate synthase/phosphatase